MFKGNPLELIKLKFYLKVWQIRNTEMCFERFRSVLCSWFHSFFYLRKAKSHAETSKCPGLFSSVCSLWRQPCCLWGWSTHAETCQQSSGAAPSSSACSAFQLPCWTRPTVTPWVTFYCVSAKVSEEESVKLSLKTYPGSRSITHLKKKKDFPLTQSSVWSAVFKMTIMPPFDATIESPPPPLKWPLVSGSLYD